MPAISIPMPTCPTTVRARGHEVPEAVLGPDAHGIFNADRYQAYPAMQQVKDGQIILALCWAHQRRDFVHEFLVWMTLKTAQGYFFLGGTTPVANHVGVALQPVDSFVDVMN